MDKKIKYRRVSYAEFGSMMDELVDRVPQLAAFTHIFAPPRGGWPMGVHLSHRLKIPILYNFYDLRNQVVVPQLIPGKIIVLFSDDIVDSGNTLSHFNTYSHKMGGWFAFFSCCLFCKSHSPIKPDIFIEEVEDDTWVVFPWERPVAEEDRQVYLQKNQERDPS